MNSTISYAEKLNRECRCTTLCEKTLQEKLTGIRVARPNLFSETTTYLSENDYVQIKELIRVSEKIISDPFYQQTILERKSTPYASGVFMGYDFHLTDEGARLIEINTNAGGAYLNLILARSQEECCTEENLFFRDTHDISYVDHVFMQMFREEWRLLRGNETLRTIAIMDNNPTEQFLAPEFNLFRDLFLQHGYEAFILDPKETDLRSDGLYYQEKKIDLIYNRLTDFDLSESSHKHIFEAWTNNQLVLTPTPTHHLLYAHKKNLVFLTDAEFLKKLNLTEAERKTVLTMVPQTRLVKKCDPVKLWAERKNLFFKPVVGFGSKATYRGDKMTTRVWSEILQGDYVAQALIRPGQRVIAGKESALKVDIRAYAYEGKILLLAARLYEGQTTNFRTNGGGFSPVVVVSGQGK
jgi:hypothetical protein